MSDKPLAEQCEEIWPVRWRVGLQDCTSTEVWGIELRIYKDQYRIAAEAFVPRSASLRDDLQAMRERVCAFPRDIPELLPPPPSCAQLADKLLAFDGWRREGITESWGNAKCPGWFLFLQGDMFSLNYHTTTGMVPVVRGGFSGTDTAAVRDALARLFNKLPRFT